MTSTDPARDADLAQEFRYDTALGNAVSWWFHDAFVHPFTGTIGLAGRLTKSLRLISLSHHIHNVTAPSNDVLADYTEAAYRAMCNETSNDPIGSMTPDEQDHARARYQDITGDEGYILGEQAFEALRRMGKRPWTGQSRGLPPPTDEEFDKERGEESSHTRVSPLVELSDALDWLREENIISQHAIAQLARDPELLERWFRWKQEKKSRP